jgi:CBS domain-containing protein
VSERDIETTEKERPAMLVKHVMTSDVRTCPPEATIAGAARIMSARECGAVPVVDARQKLIGILTDRDVCLALASRARKPDELPVGDVMSRKVYTCSPDDDTVAALTAMQQHHVRRLPVVGADGRIVGMLSIDDIVSRMGRTSDAEIPSEEVVETLQSLSVHMSVA